MSISVVMTSYNGEDYIYEQLYSIYNQTLQPDEVIIFDDCSKDKTVAIIENFIKSYNLKNWKLTVNTKNKGWKRNFLEALNEAHGTYIFFSDQDDVWYRDKIEVMANLMEKHSEILCLTGKVTVINSKGTIMKEENNLSFENSFGHFVKYNFSASFNTVIMPGCSMCIKKKLADIIIKVNALNYSYDEQCCRLGILLEGTYTLEKPVIYHRVHKNNATNFMGGISFGSSNLQKRIDSIKNNIIWLEKLLKTSELQELLNVEKKSYIINTILFQNERLKFLSHKNIACYIKLFQYRKYYSGMAMYFGDFTYAFYLNKLAGRILWYLKSLKSGRINIFGTRIVTKK